MGKEEKTAFLHIKGPEEIELFCEEINHMVSRLSEICQTTLGQMTTDYQTLKSALDALSEPVFLLDDHLNILFINHAAQQFLSRPGEVKTASFFAHVNVDGLKSGLIKIAKQVLDTQTPFLPKTPNDAISIEKETKQIRLLPWAYPIKKRVENGYQVAVGVIIILQDLMGQPLAKVGKTDIYESLIHEFQAPLTDVHMAIHLCTQGAAGPLTPKQEEILYDARDKCAYLEKLCQNLLNLSQANQKKITSETEEVDLTNVILNLIRSLQIEANQKHVFINFEEPPYLSKIKANPNQVQTIFRNLFRNAIYYADNETIIKVKLSEKKNAIEFSINNKGPLIAPEYHKKVFEKYFKMPGQTQERAGIGLYITKKLVRTLGGKIGLKSTEKEGTTFWVRLPPAPENNSELINS